MGFIARKCGLGRERAALGTACSETASDPARTLALGAEIEVGNERDQSAGIFVRDEVTEVLTDHLVRWTLKGLLTGRICTGHPHVVVQFDNSVHCATHQTAHLLFSCPNFVLSSQTSEFRCRSS